MKLIAIESSGMTAGVALIEDGVIKGEYNVNHLKTHSQTLLPMLDELKTLTELDMNTLDAIAVSAGPGSFTGLRIGSATAKGLGLALDIPIVEISTLEGLAYNLYGTGKVVCPIMDARRSQVYTAVYGFPDDTAFLQCIKEPCAIDIKELLAFLKNDLKEECAKRGVVFLGDGVPVYRETIDAELGADFAHSYAKPHMCLQRAASVAALGEMYMLDGKSVNADDHAPTYLRSSQAERVGPGKFEI